MSLFVMTYNFQGLEKYITEWKNPSVPYWAPNTVILESPGGPLKLAIAGEATFHCLELTSDGRRAVVGKI